MNLSAKVAHNTIIQMASKIIATFLGLVAVAIMTRVLGRFGYGQYTTIMTFLAFFGVLADFGLTLVTTRMLSEPGVDEQRIINNLFTLRFFSALVFLGLAPLAILFFPYAWEIKVGVSIMTLSFFFTALNQVFVGVFQKNLRMDLVSIAEVAGRIFLVVAVFLVAELEYGVLGMALATVLAGAVSFFLHFIFVRRFFRIKFAFDPTVWKKIFKISWPLAITIAFNLVYLRADALILSLVKSQEDVGLYGAAYKLIDVLSLLPFVFAGLVFPILSRSFRERNFDFFARVVRRSFDLMAILAVPLVVGAQFLADDLMAVVAGSDFILSGSILKILIIAVAAIFLGCVFSHAIVAIDRQKEVILAYVFTGLSSLVAYLLFVPRFSYFGAAWVTIYSEFAISFFSLFYIWKYMKVRPHLAVFGKALLSSFFMAIFLYFFRRFFTGNIYMGLSISLLVASAIYFLSLYLLKGISREDVSNLFNKKNV